LWTNDFIYKMKSIKLSPWTKVKLHELVKRIWHEACDARAQQVKKWKWWMLRSGKDERQVQGKGIIYQYRPLFFIGPKRWLEKWNGRVVRIDNHTIKRANQLLMWLYSVTWWDNIVYALGLSGLVRTFDKMFEKY